MSEIKLDELLKQGFGRMFYSCHTPKMNIQIVKFVKNETDALKLINHWNIQSITGNMEYRYIFDQFDTNTELKQRATRLPVNYRLSEERGIQFASQDGDIKEDFHRNKRN